MPTRERHDAIAAALARASDHLASVNPALAALVQIVPQAIDPNAIPPVLVRDRRSIYSQAFPLLPIPLAATGMAHAALHILLRHDERLWTVMQDTPQPSARLFNLSCDISIASILAPLVDHIRERAPSADDALRLQAVDSFLPPAVALSLPIARRLGFADFHDLAAAEPETIYSVLLQLPRAQQALALGAPNARPLCDDLRPVRPAADETLLSANDKLTSVARHICVTLADSDTSGMIARIRAHLQPAPSDWRSRLRALLERAANPPPRTSYARPDRRQHAYATTAVYLPGRARQKRRPIVAIIDPAAAIAPRHIAAFVAELHRIRRARPVTVQILIANATPRPLDLSPTVSPPQLDARPTNMRSELAPAFDVAAAHDPSLIICLTDLFFAPLTRPKVALAFFAPPGRPAPFGRHFHLPAI